MAVLLVVTVGVGVLRTTSLHTAPYTKTVYLTSVAHNPVAMFVVVDFYKTFIVCLADLGGRAVYGGSLAGVAGSNLAAGRDVCLLCVVR